MEHTEARMLEAVKLGSISRWKSKNYAKYFNFFTQKKSSVSSAPIKQGKINESELVLLSQHKQMSVFVYHCRVRKVTLEM